MLTKEIPENLEFNLGKFRMYIYLKVQHPTPWHILVYWDGNNIEISLMREVNPNKSKVFLGSTMNQQWLLYEERYLRVLLSFSCTVWLFELW